MKHNWRLQPTNNNFQIKISGVHFAVPNLKDLIKYYKKYRAKRQSTN